MTHRLLAFGIALIAIVGMGRIALSGERRGVSRPPVAGASPVTARGGPPPGDSGPVLSRPAVPAVVAPPAPITAPPGAVALAGCPVPPRPPGPPPPAPAHPTVLVADKDLPPVAEPPPFGADLAPTLGRGMWIWQLPATEHGDARAIVARAASTGLHQIWVRVGDSFDGFYGASTLDALVAQAHARGIAVIGWGFPYLYDPVRDAQWGAAALAWRGSGGASLDGFSPDIEMATEGVALSERRVAVYLGELRRAAGNRLLVATVYRPTDRFFAPGAYPYATIAKYVDEFAPMVYWGCTEPGDAVAQAISRLARLRPVHVIGQAYDMGPEGGRPGAPGGAELSRFLDAARRRGALGASFWVWQDMTDAEWKALTASSW
ncbi:MAG: hypothetical protein ACYDAD_12510 [Acidimicrobiales bacterium]